mgnify:FL=1
MWIIAWILVALLAVLAVLFLISGIVLSTIALVKARRDLRDVVSFRISLITLVVSAVTLLIGLGTFAAFYDEF